MTAFRLGPSRTIKGAIFPIVFALFICCLATPGIGQTMMPLPAYGSSYSGAMVRGYYFQAPVNFIVVGLRVPTDVGTGNQSIQFVRFTAGPPPQYATLTTSFVTLGYWYNQPGTGQIACNISVSAGDWIGVYGYRAQICSYAATSGAFTSSIGGQPCVLKRSGYQGNIDAGTPAPNFWAEDAGQLSRVEMYYTQRTAPNDAGIASIDSPFNFCAGTYPVTVTLKNFGTMPLTSAKINWTLNGVPKPQYSWTGYLDTLNQTTRITQVTIGNETFNSGIPYNIQAWTTMPNGIADTINNNDSTKVVRQAAIAGTFTIGGASPTYANFAAAVAALNANGLCGPVVFNVRPGTYTEQVNINAINGASAANTVTFQSETGNRADVTLTYAASTSGTGSATLNMNGTDYVTFQNMTIVATGASYGYTVYMASGCDYNRFINCNIRTVNSTSSLHACIYSPSGSTDNYNEFRDNLIEYGYYGIYWYGSSTTSLDTRNVFDNNTIRNFYYYGILAYYQDAPRFTRNVIQTNSTTTNYGMYMYYNYNDRIVSGNKIYFTGSGYKYGLMNYYSYGTSTQPGLVTNNFVTISSAQTGYYPTYIYYNDYNNYYNNTFYNGTTTTSYYGAYIYYGSFVKLINNMFYHAGPGYSVYCAPGTNVTASDYNLYYSTGTSLAYWNGTIANLAALRAATGRDQNSISKTVSFASPSTGDLHLVGASQDDVALTGTPLAEVTVDIDGEPRARPYIGADEGCYITPGSVTYDITDASGNAVTYFNYPGTIYVRYNIAFPATAFTATITLNFYTVPANTLVYTTSFNVNKLAGIPATGIQPIAIPAMASGYYRIEGVFLTANSCNLLTTYKPGDDAALALGAGQTPCLVWPGDVTNNGVVDYGDRSGLNKYIQMANLSPTWLQGPARYRADYMTNPFTYYTWEAQAAAPWTTPDGCYMDADGNGLINSFDYIAIRFNWLRSHGITPKTAGTLTPQTFDMAQNYPNPFNPTTTISYSVPERSDVRLVVTDMLGRDVAILYNGTAEAGVHTAVFDAASLNSGQYVASITMTGQSGLSFSKTIKMTLAK
jgi:hypothetical protein